MAQPRTRTQKTLQGIGAARGNLAFLGQRETCRMPAILGLFATEYRIPISAMTRSKSIRGATSDDSAAALIANLDRLTVAAGFIRGINRVDSVAINSHLHALASECKAFALAQTLGEPLSLGIDAAMQRFLERGLGSGSFSGAALA